MFEVVVILRQLHLLKLLLRVLSAWTRTGLARRIAHLGHNLFRHDLLRLEQYILLLNWLHLSWTRNWRLISLNNLLGNHVETDLLLLSTRRFRRFNLRWPHSQSRRRWPYALLGLLEVKSWVLGSLSRHQVVDWSFINTRAGFQEDQLSWVIFGIVSLWRLKV